MLCVLFFCVICEKKYNCETRWGFFSLREHTEASAQACPLSVQRGVGGEASLGFLIPPNKRTEGEVELFLQTKEEP